MAGFTNPTFQERQEAAARARSAALARYQSRPPVDEEAVARRAARDRTREDAAAAKRAALKQAKEEAAEAKREQERQAAAAALAEAEARAAAAAEARAAATARKVEERKLWTEEDRKAARDARYAARKARQGRR